MGRIISISVDDRTWELIRLHKLSPSKIFRKAIDDFEQFSASDMIEDRKSLNAKILRLSKNLQNYAKFVQEKGLGDEFIQTEAFN